MCYFIGYTGFSPRFFIRFHQIFLSMTFSNIFSPQFFTPLDWFFRFLGPVISILVFVCSSFALLSLTISTLYLKYILGHFLLWLKLMCLSLFISFLMALIILIGLNLSKKFSVDVNYGNMSMVVSLFLLLLTDNLLKKFNSRFEV